MQAARLQEPIALTAVDADTIAYTGDTIAALIAEGVDVCIPDNFTACDLHRQQPVATTRAKVVGSVEFTYAQPEDTYTCPEGMVVLFRQQRPRGGQEVRVYQARQSCPTDCPLAKTCGACVTRKRRMLTIRVNDETLQAHLQRFCDPTHVERYRCRAPAVETVFGFVRAVFGYSRWLLRGAERVRAEARLFTAAYQVRKVHSAWSRLSKQL